MSRLQEVMRPWNLVFAVTVAAVLLVCSSLSYATGNNSGAVSNSKAVNTSGVVGNSKVVNAGLRNSPGNHSGSKVIAHLQQDVSKIQYNEANVINGLSAKFNLLQDQNKMLAADLFQTQQNLSKLHQQLIRIESQAQPVAWNQRASAVFLSWAQSSEQMFGAVGFKLVSGLAAIFLLWVIWSLRPRRRKGLKSKLAQSESEVDGQHAMSAVQADTPLQTQAEKDLEGEYDFLNTPEAIPTKLDLARAYLAMGNLIAAQKVLQEVIAKGNLEQQQMAKNLMAKAAPQVP